MSFVIVCQNEKGGVGKSTLTVNFSAALAELGHRVLIVDVDTQGTTSHLFLGDSEVSHSVHDIFGASTVPLSEITQATSYDRLSIIPSDDRLRAFEQSYGYESNANVMLLNDSLAEISDEFEYIVIDTPPRSHLTLFAALVAADLVLTPVEPEGFSVDSVMALQNQLESVRETKNPGLQVRYVINKVDEKWAAHRKIRDKMHQYFGDLALSSQLHRYATVANAALVNQPVTVYDSKSTAAKEIRLLAAEVIEQFVQSPQKVNTEHDAIKNAA